MPAAAQQADASLTAWAVPRSQAVGIEMLGLRLRVMQHFRAPYDHALLESFKKQSKADWDRFGGTLTLANPTLANQLRGLLGEIVEEAEEGDDIKSTAASAERLLAEVRAAVLPPDIRDDPAHVGLVMRALLLRDGGVAGAYAAAPGAPWTYPVGYFALSRVDEAWTDLGAAASADQREEYAAMLAVLRGLYPDPGPPDTFLGWTPDAGETPSRRMAGVLEQAVPAPPHGSGDFGALASGIADLSQIACASYAAGQGAAGIEVIFAIHDLFEGEFTELLGALAPVESGRALVLFGRLIPGVTVPKEASTAVADQLSSVDTCYNLQATLGEIRGIFGG